MTTVNKERVKLIVDALRSGDYKQGTGSLERMDINEGITHCCLGVACRAAMKAGLEVPVKREGQPKGYLGQVTFFGEDANRGALPIEVMKWFGFTNDDPIIGPNDETAITLNDDLKYTFDQIANCFEDTYLKEETNAT